MERTRKPPKPLPASGESPFFIPVDDDDEDEPTRARVLPEAPQPAPSRSAPRPVVPPPTPRAAFAAPPPPRPVVLESPFEEDEDLGTEEDIPLTPLPPMAPVRPSGRYELPRPSAGYGSQPHLPPAPQPFNLRPPETIDFSDAAVPRVLPRKSGPPGVITLIVLLAAAAGGAKLAEMATRQDMADLHRASAKPSDPSAAQPAIEPMPPTAQPSVTPSGTPSPRRVPARPPQAP